MNSSIAASMQSLLASFAAFVAVLFLYSGVSKLSAVSAFSDDLRLIPYFPDRFARGAAITISSLETATGILILFDYPAAKLLAVALLITFCAVAWLAIVKDQRVPCHCFGIDHHDFLSWSTIVRNVLLALGLLCTIAFGARHSPFLTEIHGVIGFLLLLTVNQALQNHREFIHSFRAPLQ